MATLEGTRASAEFMVRSVAPDFCKSPTIIVGYQILSFFNCAVNFSTNVRFRKQWVFRHNSRLTTVIGNESGVGGGIASQVNKGFCRPIDGTSSTTFKVNGVLVDCHQKTYMFMNCAGPEGQYNTVGQVTFLGNMLPGPVAPSGKIPKGSFCGTPGITDQLQDLMRTDIDGLVEKGQMLYDLAKTDWSDPSAVLGAIGGVAGIAGLQDIASAAQKAKELYDKGKKIYGTGNKLLNTDWSDPKQALTAIAGVANVAGMKDMAQAADMASKIRDAVRADWSDPRQAYAAATTIMQTTGMNEMFSQMASNAILDSNIPVNTRGNMPPIFPPPGGTPGGTPGNSPGNPSSGNANTCGIPASPVGTPRFPINQDVINYFQDHNPVALDRYNQLSDEQKCNAFVEISHPNAGTHEPYPELSRAAMYIPGEGFSTTRQELDALPNVSSYLPDGFTSLFVASQDSRSIGRFFGIEQKDGNAYLFGGLVDLGSPGMPGAGNASSWWVPDRILNADMSPYYDKHDRDYYGSNVRLGDLGNILGLEVDTFRTGATLNPLQLPLQALYSAATTAVGVGTATFNSFGDAFSTLFGGGSAPIAAGGPMPLIHGILPGGCMPDIGMGPGTGFPGAPSAPSSMPGTGGCFPGGTGAPPAPAEVSVPEGAASGAGADGVVVTIWAGNPTAAANAALAEIRALNAAAAAKASENSNIQFSDNKGGKTSEDYTRPDTTPLRFEVGPDGTKIPVYEKVEWSGKDNRGGYNVDKHGPYILTNPDLDELAREEVSKNELSHANDDFGFNGQYDKEVKDFWDSEIRSREATIRQIEENRSKYPSEEAYQQRLREEREMLRVIRTGEYHDFDQGFTLMYYDQMNRRWQARTGRTSSAPRPQSRLPNDPVSPKLDPKPQLSNRDNSPLAEIERRLGIGGQSRKDGGVGAGE